MAARPRSAPSTSPATNGHAWPPTPSSTPWTTAPSTWQYVHSRPIQGGDGASADDPNPSQNPAAEAGDLQVTAEQRKTAAEAALAFLADGTKRERYEIIDALRPVTTSLSTVKGALRKLVDAGHVAHPAEKGPYWITDASRAALDERKHVA